MEKFHSSAEGKIEKDEGKWCYEKVNGEWQLVLLQNLPDFDPSTYQEKERRTENFLQMMKETKERWKLDDPTVPHNEGILRDHPRYHELFLKWAMRRLRLKGFDSAQFSGKIDQDEGNLLRPDGAYSRTWLVNAVANDREWVDENIEMELRISEGFVDITHDEERQKELGIEPQLDGWWTQDEI